MWVHICCNNVEFDVDRVMASLFPQTQVLPLRVMCLSHEAENEPPAVLAGAFLSTRKHGPNVKMNI